MDEIYIRLIVALLSFLFGACSTAWLMIRARRKKLERERQRLNYPQIEVLKGGPE